jgi:hypothetical protein
MSLGAGGNTPSGIPPASASTPTPSEPASGTPPAVQSAGTPAAPTPAKEPKTFSWTPMLQMLIAASSVCVAAAAISFAVRNFYDARNAQLVQIGVDVLKVDPTKDKQVAAARRWALDLIDANAGVKFSEADRRDLLESPLTSQAHVASEIGLAVTSAIRNSPQQ